MSNSDYQSHYVVGATLDDWFAELSLFELAPAASFVDRAKFSWGLDHVCLSFHSNGLYLFTKSRNSTRSSQNVSLKSLRCHRTQLFVLSVVIRRWRLPDNFRSPRRSLKSCRTPWTLQQEMYLTRTTTCQMQQTFTFFIRSFGS